MPPQPTSGHCARGSPYSNSLPTRSSLPILLLLLPTLALTAQAAISPRPVGGFAICQTSSSLHIQGGVSFAYPSATSLETTNQHFRLDLSQPFDSSTPPTWANLTSDYSPFQRFHSGACTPDTQSFITIGNGNARSFNSSLSFMSAYSISKGTWSPVSQAVSTSTGGGSRNKDSENTAAGRTMVGFALFSPTPGSLSKAAMGVAVGGGWLPPKSKADSVQATELTNLAMETNLINFGRDGNLGSLAWTTSSSSNSLSSLAGARVVILPGGTEALVVGGVTTTKNGGLPFDSMPIIDLVTGAVLLQKTQSPIFSGPPLPRYGHCVVLSSDGNTLIMFGGSLVRDDKLTNDLYTLDLKTWRWTQQSPKGQNSGPPPVRDHQCIRVGDQLLSFLGFNSNLWPASSTDPGYPSAPPIYVLSVPQWTWSRQFTPIPGTPPPPPPPNVSTDGSKGKISGVGIAFGVVFGLAFVGMVAYLVFSHKRRQRKKKEVLIQIELEERRKEEAKLEKERQKKEQEGLPPIPPPSSIPSDHVSGNMGGPMFYGNNGYGQHDNYMQPYASPGMSNFGGPAYMPQQNPFHNPAYQSDPPVGPNPFHSPVPAPAAQYYSPHPSPTPLPMNMPQHPAYSQEGPSSYVPEEMGHTSPTLPPAQQYQQHQPHYPPGGYLGPPGSMASPAQGTSLVNAGARDKFSFIEPTSTYR